MGREKRTGRWKGRQRPGIKSLTMGLALLLLLTACGAPQPARPEEGAGKGASGQEGAMPTSITVAANGGVVERAIRDHIGAEFTKKTGIPIDFIAGLSSEIVARIEASPGNPTIDLAFIEPLDVLRLKEKGLIEPLDDASLPNRSALKADYQVEAIQDVWVPTFGYIVAPAYNTKAFEKNGWAPIASWNDLARREFKGRTAYVDVPNTWALLALYFLALANGGDFDHLDPGLEKAKEMARISETFYKNSTQVMPVMQQGLADVTYLSTYVIAALADQGVPIKMAAPKEGVPLQAIGPVVPKGTPKGKAARQFIDFFLEKTSQAALTELGFSSVVEGVGVADKYKDVLALQEGTKAFIPSPEKLMELRGTWSDRWAQEVRPELGKGLK